MTTLEKELSMIPGSLVTAFSQVDLDTISHAWEIVNEIDLEQDSEKRRSLMNPTFWTADFQLYCTEHGKQILYLAPKEHNLIFKNSKQAFRQLDNVGYYTPNKGQVEKLKENAVNLADLKTFPTDIPHTAVLRFEIADLISMYKSILRAADIGETKFDCFDFYTDENKVDSYTQVPFINRVCGNENDFGKNKRNVFNSRLLRIYFLKQCQVEYRCSDSSESIAFQSIVYNLYSNHAWFTPIRDKKYKP